MLQLSSVIWFPIVLLESASACSLFSVIQILGWQDRFQPYTGIRKYPIWDRCFNFIHKIRITLQGVLPPWPPWCNSKFFSNISYSCQVITELITQRIYPLIWFVLWLDWRYFQNTSLSINLQCHYSKSESLRTILFISQQGLLQIRSSHWQKVVSEAAVWSCFEKFTRKQIHRSPS